MPQSEVGPRRRRWLPRFSLAALFVLVTLSAVGVWYWYQWPFGVENVTYATAGPDPFAASGASTPPAGPKEIHRRSVTYVRRVWSREEKTIRHGPRKVYDGQDRLLSESHYNNGVRHGRLVDYFPNGQPQVELFFVRGVLHGGSRRWNAAGQLLEETNYDHGQKHGRYFRADKTDRAEVEGAYEQGTPAGKWSWFPPMGPNVRFRGEYATIVGQWRDGAPDGKWVCRDGNGQVYLTADFDRGRLLDSEPAGFEPRLIEVLAERKLADPVLMSGLLRLVSATFHEIPLKDVIKDLSKTSGITIVCGVRGPATSEQMAIAFPPAAKQESYLVPFSREVNIRVPVDPQAPLAQYEWVLPAMAAENPQPIAVADLPVSAEQAEMPILFWLRQVLQPLDLACDYRYGVLWIDRVNSIAQWKDRTGISELQPPAGSRLAEQWNAVTFGRMEFVETPVADALLFMQDSRGPGLKFDAAAVQHPPGPLLPRAVRASAQYRPVTVTAQGLPLKHELGLILDQAECRATLRGQTLVIEPQ